MNLQHLQPAIAIRHANLDLTVKSARPTQSRIYRIRTIRRPDHHHLSPRLETIHQRQELRRNSFLYLSSDLFSLRRNRINLVDEDDRRRILLCFLENVPQPFLAFSIIFAHDLWSAYAEKVRVRLTRNRSSYQSLPRAWRSMKQDTFRRLDSQSLKQLRMSQRELNHLPDLLDHGSQTANVLVTDLGNRTDWFFDLFADKNLRSLSNNDGLSGRTRISHNQIDSPSHDIDRNEVSPRQNPPLQELAKILFSANDTERLCRS